jgi:hypothetical protein
MLKLFLKIRDFFTKSGQRTYRFKMISDYTQMLPRLSRCSKNIVIILKLTIPQYMYIKASRGEGWSSPLKQTLGVTHKMIIGTFYYDHKI